MISRGELIGVAVLMVIGVALNVCIGKTKIRFSFAAAESPTQ
jgi:hypothetical protein